MLNISKKIINQKAAIIVTLVAIIVIIAFICINNYGKNSTVTTYKATNACDLLTLDEAKTLLGDDAILGEHYDPDSGNIVSVSQCSYTNGQSDLSLLRVIHITARSALSKDGQDSNTTAFESTNGSIPAAGDKAVKGYGDKAFWDTTVHEISILKGDLWIRISYGGADQTKNTLDDTKKVAKFVLKNASDLH